MCSPITDMKNTCIIAGYSTVYTCTKKLEPVLSAPDRGGSMWMRLPGEVPKESRRCPTGTNKKIYPLLEMIWEYDVVREGFNVVDHNFCRIVAIPNKILLESMSKRIALLENKIVWGLTFYSSLFICTNTHNHTQTVFTSCVFEPWPPLVFWAIPTTSAPSLGLTSSTLGPPGTWRRLPWGPRLCVCVRALRRSSSIGSLCVC